MSLDDDLVAARLVNERLLDIEISPTFLAWCRRWLDRNGKSDWTVHAPGTEVEKPTSPYGFAIGSASYPQATGPGPVDWLKFIVEGDPDARWILLIFNPYLGPTVGSTDICGDGRAALDAELVR